MRSYIRTMLLPTLCVFMIICSGFVCSAESVNRYEYIEIQPTLKAEPIEPIVIISEQPLEETVSAVEIEEYVEDTLLPLEDIELIALVTMAEAEGECEEGKRLVIDTILNRVDSVYFPDNVHDVVYQKHQFSSMWNGRIDKCIVDEDICQLVEEERKSRTNSNTIFFTAGGYGKYGTPMFRLGNHYFSSYE